MNWSGTAWMPSCRSSRIIAWTVGLALACQTNVRSPTGCLKGWSKSIGHPFWIMIMTDPSWFCLQFWSVIIVNVSDVKRWMWTGRTWSRAMWHSGGWGYIRSRSFGWASGRQIPGLAGYDRKTAAISGWGGGSWLYMDSRLKRWGKGGFWFPTPLFDPFVFFT